MYNLLQKTLEYDPAWTEGAEVLSVQNDERDIISLVYDLKHQGHMVTLILPCEATYSHGKFVTDVHKLYVSYNDDLDDKVEVCGTIQNSNGFWRTARYVASGIREAVDHNRVYGLLWDVTDNTIYAVTDYKLVSKVEWFNLVAVEMFSTSPLQVVSLRKKTNLII